MYEKRFRTSHIWKRLLHAFWYIRHDYLKVNFLKKKFDSVYSSFLFSKYKEVRDVKTSINVIIIKYTVPLKPVEISAWCNILRNNLSSCHYHLWKSSGKKFFKYNSINMSFSYASFQNATVNKMERFSSESYLLCKHCKLLQVLVLLFHIFLQSRLLLVVLITHVFTHKKLHWLKI